MAFDGIYWLCQDTTAVIEGLIVGIKKSYRLRSTGLLGGASLSKVSTGTSQILLLLDIPSTFFPPFVEMPLLFFCFVFVFNGFLIPQGQKTT